MHDVLGPSPGDDVYDQMVDVRRAVHRRPELAFAEHDTTALIRAHMAALGITESLRVTDTGGIFAFEGGRPGRTVVLRADIDALPVQEDPSRAGHSEIEGLMHACGHDLHVGSLLGAASVLASRQEDLPGRYVFLFQPGEEALCGAKAMVEGGALSVMEGARLIGFHVTSVIPTGIVALRAGITMSEAHALRITLRGPGGHGAVPSATGDVIRATAELVGRLRTVVEGLAFEGSDCVCSAGTLPRRHRGERRADRGDGDRHVADLHGGPARLRRSTAWPRCAQPSPTTSGSKSTSNCPSTRRRW